MDYTQKSLIFKVKKTLRYIQLYGIERTLIKIKGQYHMKKQYEKLPDQEQWSTSKMHVGLIGCGNYSFSNIAYYVRKNYGKVIKACMDTDINKAASLYEEYKLNYYTDEVSKIINDPDIDTIYIASNHATHAEYAIDALKQGKNVHIEKPHVVRADQLDRLCQAAQDSDGKIVSVGYNRPRSKLGNLIKQCVDNQEGSAMYNWFVAGHELEDDHWYFKKEEGGRVLGNLCHWTDFVYNLVPESGRFPIKIIPTRSVKSDCDIAVTYVFGDGTISAITFSAKGHTFEGVREKFAAHKGNALISMDDFKNLTIELIEKKYKTNLFYRDHGHEHSIKTSYEASVDATNKGLALDYVRGTAVLFLKTKQALEEDKVIIIE